MLILDILAAFFAAALAALGVGGGGLLVIYLVLVLNMEQRAAQGINLMFFIAASLTALPFHILKRRVKLLPVLIFSAFGVPGACLGCFLASRASSDTVRALFGLMLTLAGGITLYKTLRSLLRREPKDRSRKARKDAP